MKNEKTERTKLLLGDEAINRLKDSCVAIAGLGGVGSFAAESLARAGVGNFILADFDNIALGNINRNLLALNSTIGMPKVEVCMKRIKDISDSTNVEVFKEFLNKDTAFKFLSHRPDVLIDAIDSLNPKIELLITAYRMNVKTVSSMGAGRRTDPSFIKTGDISETEVCPLARKVRERLRKYGITNGILCVYSTEHPIEPGKDFEEPQTIKKGRKRRPVGSLSTITGIFGLLIAHEVLKIIIPEMNKEDKNDSILSLQSAD